MTYISISEGAKTLSMLDGQLQDAIRSERRWNMAVRDAAENRQRARESVAFFQRAISDVLQQMKESR